MGQVRRQGAEKRGGGRLLGESALVAADAAEVGGLDRIAGDEPTPELAAIVVDEYRRLRDGLRSEALRQVLDLRLAGYTREEIAKRLGCAERTVKRKLEVIREAWTEGAS
jgi:DNA-directed RNA polymerase specialized sigma24 family protein